MVVTGHFCRTFLVREVPGEPLEMVVSGPTFNADTRLRAGTAFVAFLQRTNCDGFPVMPPPLAFTF
jgi:hypothetical protein